MTYEETLIPRVIWGRQMKWLLGQMQELASTQYDCMTRKGEFGDSL